MRVDDAPQDVELRLIDPTRNRFRLYGLTECRTLFGELCLRIVWGRIGNRRLRERSEVFSDHMALERRRDELLRLRRRHGYESRATPRAAAQRRAAERVHGEGQGRGACLQETGRAIAEAHGLSLSDANAWRLVSRWHAATLAIARYLKARGAEVVDLVDASTLADMFVTASST